MTQVTNGSQSPLLATIQAAGISGVAGVLVGGTLGIAQRKTPIALWTLVSAVQWSLLGGSFWGIRSTLIQHYSKEEYDPAKRVLITSASGGLSFAVVGAVTRGRKNILPGTFMGLLLGFTGQSFYNIIDMRHTRAVTSPSNKPSLWERMLNSNWSPVKKLNDSEYADLLKDRLLRVEAEIAIVDEELAELEKQQPAKIPDSIKK